MLAIIRCKSALNYLQNIYRNIELYNSPFVKYMLEQIILATIRSGYHLNFRTYVGLIFSCACIICLISYVVAF